jgi:HAD superfamily hydrolase (TIGR01509 family)
VSGDREHGAAAPARAPLRAVVLDCLGTLVELEPPGPRLRVELALRGIEVPEAAAAEAFRREIVYYLAHHLEASDPGGLERLRDACADVIVEALSLRPEQLGVVRQAMLAALSFRPYEDAGRTLSALRAAGLSLVVASNWDCSLASVLARTGLRAAVDGVVTSAEVGVAKPDPGLFRAALALAESSPGEAVCVGDSIEHDVAAATAVGMEAILVARATGRSMEGVPVPVVRSLDEARPLILARG